MGFFDWDTSSVITRRSSHHHHKDHHSSSSKHKHHKSRSKSRSRSPKRHHSTSFSASIFGGDSHHKHHNSSRSSFFGLPNVSTRSFFGLSHSKPSYYKRSPRPTFVSRAYKKLKRLLRDLVHYAKKHPVKVFMLVIMPLLTGGALTALLARFGLRMPAGLERMLGIGAKAMTGDSIGLVGEAMRMAGGLGGGAGSVHLERGRQGDMRWERKSVDREGAGWGGMGAMAGGLGGLGSVAKMFM